MAKLGENTIEKDGNRLLAFLGGTNQGAGILAVDNYVDLAEQGSTPAAPDSGFGRLYVDQWGYARYQSDGGMDVPACMVIQELPVGTGRIYGTGMSILEWQSWNIQAWTFNQNGVSYLEWSFRLPSGWAGRTLNYAWFWGISSAGSGNISWFLEAARLYDGGAIPTAATVSQRQDIAVPGSTNVGKISTGSVSLASWSDGDFIVLRFGRDGNHINDTFGQSGRALGLRLWVNS